VRQWGRKGEKLEVWTALAIGLNRPLTKRVDAERATIFIERDLRDDEIPEYLDSSGGMGSSGGVIVETLTEMAAARYEGELSCIQGFPIESVRRIVNELMFLKGQDHQ
jgi:predicted house-cleaning NTP pyrophosphatase (Maf/HAM1 superfamily)